MYSERTTVKTDCNAAMIQNENQRSCGKCAYNWIDNRGLTLEQTTCPRCGSKIVRRGLVQSGTISPKLNSDISEVLEILEFTTGEKIHQRRNDIN